MKDKNLLHRFIQYPFTNSISYVFDVDEHLGDYPLAILYVGEKDGKAHAHKDVWPSIDYVKVHTGEDYSC